MTVISNEAAASASPAAVMPKAIVYRTSGDFNDKVPVTLSAAGEITNFPSPTDLGPDSAPVDLGNGYLLDRRGINRNTVFTTYTYADYRALPEAPSIARLKSAIIPGSCVTEIIELPVNVSKAAADIALCRSYVASGFEGCKVLYKAPVLKTE